MGTLKRIALLCAVLAVSGVTMMSASRPAVAQPADAATKAAALKAFKSGSKKLDAGDFAGALADFREADRIYPGASPKHKIAVCLDTLGRKKEAIAAYQAFIDSNPGAKYGDRIKESTDRIALLKEELAKMPGTVALTVEPADAAGITVTIDGAPAEGLEHELSAGEHTIEVQADGMQGSTQTVTVEPGERQELTVTLTPTETAPPPPPPEEEGGVNGLLIGGLVGAGVAVVGFGVGTAFGVMALGSKDDFQAAVDAGQPVPAEEAADDTENNALIADVFFGIGAVGVIAAAILIPLGLTADDEGTEGADTAMPKLAPVVGPEVAGMAATWTF